MTRLGFEPYLPAELQSPIITSFRYPAEAAFDFERFYTALSARGFVIYPGKLSTADCFRIGTIGDVHPGDLEDLVQAIGEVTAGMGLKTIGRAVAK